MSGSHDGIAPLWTEPTPPEGGLEKMVRVQVEKLRTLGYIEEHHSAKVELAIVAARDIDRSTGKGAPSGRANLLRVMNEILETLPQPEQASQDALTTALQFILDDGEEVQARAGTGS